MGSTTMTSTAVKEKLKSIEAEIRILKTAITERPNFDIDEANWKKVRPALKMARKQLSKELYG